MLAHAAIHALNMKDPVVRALALALLLIVCSSPLRAEPDALPAHPRLLLDAEGFAQLKARIAAEPWAAAQWDKLRADADRDLDQPLLLPPRGGNWSHNYVCPIHGARL